MDLRILLAYDQEQVQRLYGARYHKMTYKAQHESMPGVWAISAKLRAYFLDVRAEYGGMVCIQYHRFAV